jgi:hypothetical protein
MQKVALARSSKYIMRLKDGPYIDKLLHSYSQLLYVRYKLTINDITTCLEPTIGYTSEIALINRSGMHRFVPLIARSTSGPSNTARL